MYLAIYASVDAKSAQKPKSPCTSVRVHRRMLCTSSFVEKEETESYG